MEGELDDGRIRCKELGSLRNKNPWYGANGGTVMCPYPECGHIGSIITKIHCRIEHEMEREEIGNLYGPPKEIRMKIFKEGEKINA